MNAARALIARLPRAAILRLLALRPSRFAAPDPQFPAAVPDEEVPDRDLAPAALVGRLARRHDRDLAGLLNVCRRDELEGLARAVGVPAAATPPDLRAALWRWGAEREAGTAALLGTPLQPRPVLIANRLVHLAPPRGLYPPAPSYPRPVPPPASPAPPDDEPDTVDELLAAADRLLGVRLGARDSDKGAWGVRAAALLGVVERGDDEPDWRGDVEVKTVPAARDRRGTWRIVEDPAVAMAGDADHGPGSPLAKLQRVLWLVRAATDDGDTAIVSWYFLEWDGDLARLVRRHLHQRPKGPAGTDQRGWYLNKGFFADAGLLATLNGPS
jgi:hypothetical protein